MRSDRLARTLAASLARHQTRGLVDASYGLRDVVIHGRVDLQAVAEEMVLAAGRPLSPVRPSWAIWFAHDVEDRRETRRRAVRRQRLTDQASDDSAAVDAALARLRLRDFEA